VVALSLASCASAAAQAPAWQCAPTGSGSVAPALAEAARDYLGRVEAIYPHQVLGLVRAGNHYYLVNSRDVEWTARNRLHLLALRLRETYLAPERQETGAAPGSSPPPGGFTCLSVARAEREGLTRAPFGDLVLAAGQSVQLINPQEPEVAVEVRAAPDRPLNMGGILQRSAHAGIYAGLTEQATRPAGGAATLSTPEGTIIIRTASIGTSAAAPREPEPAQAATPLPPGAAAPVQVAIAPASATAPPVQVALPSVPTPAVQPIATPPPAPPRPATAVPEPETTARAVPVVLPAMTAAVAPAPSGSVPEAYEDYARAMKKLMALKRSRSVLSVGEMTYVHPAVEVYRRQHP
jgi:hypothetical protein